MKKRSVFSVVLAVMLTVLCAAGVLFVSAEAETAVNWSVTGIANPSANEYATLEDALQAAKAKTDWLETDQLIITVSEGLSPQEASVQDGALFGMETVFRGDKTRLPIVIEGGEIALSVTTGKVFCTNDYTFRNLIFPLTESGVSFFAGCGRIRFENVDLGEGDSAFFWAEDGGNAFASWSEDNRNAAKENGLIPVGISFVQTPCDALVGFGGSAEGADGIKGVLDLSDAYVQNISLCSQGATSLDGMELKVAGESAVAEIQGVSFDLACDLSVSVSGAEYIGSIQLVDDAAVAGDVSLSVSGKATVNEIAITGEGASVLGTASLVVAPEGENAPTVVSLSGSHGAERNSVLVSGGKITDFYGAAHSNSKAALSLTVSGGEIENFYGTADNCAVASVLSTVSGGKITNFYGAGSGTEQIPSVTNTVSGGTVTAFYGCDAVPVGALSNTVTGSAIVVAFCGSGTASCEEITNTLKGSATIGSFSACAGYVATLTNTLSEEAVVSGDFYGTGRAAVGAVFNTVTGGTITGDFHGADGAADSVTNVFGISGTHIYNDVYQLSGNGIGGITYGTGTGSVGEVTNTIYTNVFKKDSATDLSGACFYGTGAGTVGDVTNHFMAETQGANQVFAGTSSSADANVTGTVLNTNNGGTGHFNAHTLYPIGCSIDGALVNRFEYKNARNFPRIMSPSSSTKVSSVTASLINIKAFSGQVYLVNYTVGGDVSVTCTNLPSVSSNFCISGSVGGNLTFHLTNVKLTGTDKNRGIHATVAGNVTGTYKDVYVVDSQNDDGVFRPASAVGGTVTNTFTDLYCKLGSPFYGAYGAVGTSLADGYTGNAVTNIFNLDDGKASGTDAKIENAFYGTKAAVKGSVSNQITGYDITGNFYGSGSSVTGNVSNIFDSVNLYEEFYGTTDAQVDGAIFNTLTDSVVGRDGSGTNWFCGCFGSVASVTNTITRTYLAYCRATSYSSSSRAVRGNVTNVFTDVEIGGACFLTRGSTANAVVTSTIDGGVYSDGIVAINGKCKSATTTVKGGAVMKDWVVAWNDGAGVATNELYLEDITLGSGIAWVSEGKNLPANPLSKIYLSGTITIGAKSNLIATGIKKGADELTLHQAEFWQNQSYLTLPASLLEQVSITQAGEASGIWNKESDGNNGFVVGYNVALDAQASILVDTRIQPILWLSASAVDAYLAKGGEPLRITAAVDGVELIDQSFTSQELSALLTKDGYYKIRLATTHAGQFDSAITVVGTVGEWNFTISDLGKDAEENAIPFTVLNLAQAGATQYDALIAAAAEGEDVSDLVLASDLFKAIYNYGASACDLTDSLYTSFSTGFYVDLADNDPKYGIQEHEKVQIQSASLLMGDAIGIRLKGSLSGDAALLSLAVKCGGAEVENPIYSVDVTEGALAMDFYVNADYFGDELDVTVYYDGQAHFRFITTMKGLTETMCPAEFQDAEDARLASIAQLVQACVNCKNAENE